MQTQSAKDSKYRFGRLIGLAHAGPVVVAKNRRTAVVAQSVEEYEQRKALEQPETPTA